MSTDDETITAKLASRHHASPEGVQAALNALRSSGGTMAQFSHPDFGGMAQWSRGMTMVGDMFNAQMKAKLDAICTDLADYLTKNPDKERSSDTNHHGNSDAEVSYRSPSKSSGSWWPNNLGEPGSTGSQNDMRYAVFPTSRRLAISDGGQINVYDTADHRISGVSQSQSTDRTLTFTGQNGLVRVSDLKKVSGSNLDE